MDPEEKHPMRIIACSVLLIRVLNFIIGSYDFAPFNWLIISLFDLAKFIESDVLFSFNALEKERKGGREEILPD